jgi:hypothetical protein
MVNELIEYLASHKVVLVGAAGTLGELLVIAFNTYRRIRASKKAIVAMDAKPKSNSFLWVINPINVFRKA